MTAKRWFLTLLIAFLMGCAPVISRNLLGEVDKDLSFEAIMGDPDMFKGKTVLLGGTIIETTPLPDKTRLIILQQPLGFRNKPSTDEKSDGRFIAEAQAFLDPFVYSAGRQVTVAGTLVGKELRPLGEIDYVYPLVVSSELYLWPPEYPVDIPRFYFGIGVGKTF